MNLEVLRKFNQNTQLLLNSSMKSIKIILKTTNYQKGYPPKFTVLEVCPIMSVISITFPAFVKEMKRNFKFYVCVEKEKCQNYPGITRHLSLSGRELDAENWTLKMSGTRNATLEMHCAFTSPIKLFHTATQNFP